MRTVAEEAPQNGGHRQFAEQLRDESEAAAVTKS